MLRRLIPLSMLLLALGAAPALADGNYRLHTQMAAGSSTSSRQAGGCSIRNGSHSTLVVSCSGGSTAKLGYTFATGSLRVQGSPMGSPYLVGHAHTKVATTATAHTVHVAITISGGTATIGSVCVSYYA